MNYNHIFVVCLFFSLGCYIYGNEWYFLCVLFIFPCFCLLASDC